MDARQLLIAGFAAAAAGDPVKHAIFTARAPAVIDALERAYEAAGDGGDVAPAVRRLRDEVGALLAECGVADVRAALARGGAYARRVAIVCDAVVACTSTRDGTVN